MRIRQTLDDTVKLYDGFDVDIDDDNDDDDDKSRYESFFVVDTTC